MQTDNTAREKSRAFAVRMVRLYQYLCEEKKEYVLSKQILRSGTSIGANLAEAETAISRRDFLAKLYIALKETDYLTQAQYGSLYRDGEELRKILSSSTKTLNESLRAAASTD